MWMRNDLNNPALPDFANVIGLSVSNYDRLICLAPVRCTGLFEVSIIRNKWNDAEGRMVVRV